MFRCLLHVWALLVWVLLLAAPAPVRAQEPEQPVEAPAQAEPAADPATEGEAVVDPEAVGSGTEDPQVAVATALEARARNVRALIAGTLDPSIEAAGLFSIQLDAIGADGRTLVELAASVQAAVAAAREATEKPPKRRREPAPIAKPPEPAPVQPDPVTADSQLATARQDLTAAYVEFFSLPAEEAQARLDAHREKVRLAAEAAGYVGSLGQQISETNLQAERLEALLDGTLDPDVDPSTLLQIDLLGEREFLRREKRRLGVIGTEESPPEEVADPVTSAQTAELESALAAAEKRLDQARLKYLALSPAERAARLATHAASDVEGEPSEPAEPEPVVPEEFVDVEAEQDAAEISDAVEEAAEAAREKEEALEVARQARSEALRFVAEERARLLGIKERQALFAAALPRWKQESRELHEATLELHRRVDELEAGAADEEQRRVVDGMYVEVRSVLGEMRVALADALNRLSEPGATIPRPDASTEEGELPPDVDRASLVELRRELLAEAARLQREETDVGWEVAEILRDDVVSLNRDRLVLLSRATAELRSEVTGLSPGGFEQAKAEAGQIALEIRYHAMSLPRDVAAAVEVVSRRPVDFVVLALEVLALVAVFRFWRRRADDLLRRWSTPSWSAGQSPWVRRGKRLLGYLRRIRSPLEWLLLLGALPLIITNTASVPELRLLWLVIVASVGGWAVVVIVDALAAQQSTYGASRRENAALRLRSLRLIGITVTAVALILVVTADMVGRGAIYHWVFQGCWVLVAPIGIWLVSRWQPTIFERVGAVPRSNALTTWVSANQGGLLGFLSGTVGGLYLLYRGVTEWVLRQLSSLDATRKVLAYLFRREVAKRAEASSFLPRGKPIEGKVFDQLGPESAGTTAALLDSPARALVDEAVELTVADACTLSAVVGERGAGKTTFLKRVIERSNDATCLVSCPPEGFEALLEVLAVQFGAESYEPESVTAAIRKAGAALICIDDAQRMIAPAVGGLEQLDSFTRFALEVGGDVSWIVGIQRASWQFVGRARGDRVFFDQVLELPRWSEEQIAALIDGRSTAAGIEPSFDELVVSNEAADEPAEGKRTELGYYRILWDHSGGNPAVALQAWRESLFSRADETKPVVRLFVEPSASEIERLSPTVVFVLRAVVQLELASASEVAACTQLPEPDVADALRYSITHGYTERIGDRHRLAWSWYRTITTVLKRQHLLVA